MVLAYWPKSLQVVMKPGQMPSGASSSIAAPLPLSKLILRGQRVSALCLAAIWLQPPLPPLRLRLQRTVGAKSPGVVALKQGQNHLLADLLAAQARIPAPICHPFNPATQRIKHGNLGHCLKHDMSASTLSQGHRQPWSLSAKP